MNKTLCGRGLIGHRSVLCISFTALILQGDAENSAENSPAPSRLPDILVTARRLEEYPLDVPSYSQVISRDTIEHSGASNLIELLKGEANLNFTSLSSSPTNTTVSLRGTGNNSGNGRTLVIVNGIRANRADTGQFNWLQFPVQDIESIEILQGPQGGYFGDNAVGGVIKINTRGIPSSSRGQVSVMAGSYGTLKASADYSHVAGNLWASVSGGHDQADGYRAHSGYASDSGAVNFGYDNRKNVATQFGFAYLNSHFDQPEALSLAQYRVNPRQDGGNFSDGWSKMYRITASNRLGEKEGSQVLTDFGYFQTDEYANQRALGTRFNRSIDGLSFAPKLLCKMERGNIRLGLDLNADRLDSTATTPAQGKLQRFGVSPYLGGELFLNQKLSLSGVIRREFNEIRAESSIPSPQSSSRSAEGDAYQLALNYKPTKATRLYVKLDQTYRFPATDEIAYYQGFPAPVFFNQNLKAERSRNYELGADYQKGAWQGGFASYLMKTNDEIAYNGIKNLNENLAKTQRVGAQTHLRYDNGVYGFHVRADFVDARVIEDPINNTNGRIPLTPKWNTSETLFYRPVPECTVSVGHRYKGGSTASPSSFGTLPGVSFFDVKMTYDLTQAWAVYAGVNNVADRKSISSNFFGAIYPDEGRFMFLGSTYKF